MFVTLTRSDFFAADEARSFNESTKQRFATIYQEQNNDAYLKANALPKVCQGMDYTPPVTASHNAGPKHENTFAISNNAHSKQTNNGYKRSHWGGGFYAH